MSRGSAAVVPQLAVLAQEVDVVERPVEVVGLEVPAAALDLLEGDAAQHLDRLVDLREAHAPSSGARRRPAGPVAAVAGAGRRAAAHEPAQAADPQPPVERRAAHADQAPVERRVQQRLGAGRRGAVAADPRGHRAQRGAAARDPRDGARRAEGDRALVDEALLVRHERELVGPAQVRGEGRPRPVGGQALRRVAVARGGRARVWHRGDASEGVAQRAPRRPTAERSARSSSQGAPARGPRPGSSRPMRPATVHGRAPARAKSCGTRTRSSATRARSRATGRP